MLTGVNGGSETHAHTLHVVKHVCYPPPTHPAFWQGKLPNSIWSGLLQM